jgi:hypothetical protein
LDPVVSTIRAEAWSPERIRGVAPCCGVCGEAVDTWHDALLDCNGKICVCVWALCDEQQVTEYVSSVQKDDAKPDIFELMEIYI